MAEHNLTPAAQKIYCPIVPVSWRKPQQRIGSCGAYDPVVETGHERGSNLIIEWLILLFDSGGIA